MRLVKAERLMIVCPAGPVTALAVSADGARLASGHADGTLAVWDRATGKPLGAVKAHDGEVTHVAFGPGGKMVVSLGPAPGAATELLGWTVEVNSIVPAPASHRSLGTNRTCATAAADGSVYAGDSTGGLHKFDLTDAKRNQFVRIAEKDRVTAVAVSPDAQFLLAGTSTGKVVKLSPALARGEIDDQGRGPVTALAVSAHGVYQVGFGDGSLRYGSHSSIRGRQPQVSTDERAHWIAPLATGFAVNAAQGRVRFGRFAREELATGEAGPVRAGCARPTDRRCSPPARTASFAPGTFRRTCASARSRPSAA